MKKFILIIILSMISLAVSAKASDLHAEPMFNGSYNAKASVSLNISKSPSNISEDVQSPQIRKS